jgi:hypothetical protein
MASAMIDGTTNVSICSSASKVSLHLPTRSRALAKHTTTVQAGWPADCFMRPLRHGGKGYDRGH